MPRSSKPHCTAPLTVEPGEVEYVHEVVPIPHPRLEATTHEEISVVAHHSGVDGHAGSGRCVFLRTQALPDLQR